MDRAASDIDELWQDYLANRGQAERDRLILHYSPLVKFVAGRLGSGLPQSVEQAELVSNGMFGLMDAIAKFEPERGFKFETYAMRRIRGAILDELRSYDWVPRSVRSKARSVERALARFEAEHHRPPSDYELAEELDMDPEQLNAVLTQVSNAGLVALDEVLAPAGERSESITLGDTIADESEGPNDFLERQELREVLAEQIEELPGREKLVLTLYYYEGLTLAEIGEVLSVTESRICQVHTKAVLHLKARLAAVERDRTRA